MRIIAPPYPYWVRKDHHIYVIHIARVAGLVWPTRSKELKIFKELKQFSSGFKGETRTEVHRRVLDPAFLAAAGRIHAEIERTARAAQRSAPTPAPPATATAQVCPRSVRTWRERGARARQRVSDRKYYRGCSGNHNEYQHQETL